MRVIVAGRLSRKVKDRDQTGFDSQERESVRWAREHGHKVVAVVADFKTGRSGLDARPHLRPWVTKEDKLAEYDGIVALKVDRLTRGDRAETAKLEDWARDTCGQCPAGRVDPSHQKSLLIAGADVHFPAEGNEGIAWDIMLRIAHQEWLNTSERYSRMQRTRRDQGSLVGRPAYGLRVVKLPNGLKSIEPDPETGPIVADAVARYLRGESMEDIAALCGMERKSFTRLLRNPAIAGRRYGTTKVNSKRVSNEELGKPPDLVYPGIITWHDHLAILAKMGARAYRKGISPANVALLTSIIFDANGHPMYAVNKTSRYGLYYCRKSGCHAAVNLHRADAKVSGFFEHNPTRYLVDMLVPGDNHADQIEQLRQERAELDDMSDSYDAEHARLTAEIRRLVTLDREHPNPDRWEEIDSGKSYGDVWETMTVAERRDMMMDGEMRVTWLGNGDWQIHLGRMELDIAIPDENP